MVKRNEKDFVTYTAKGNDLADVFFHRSEQLINTKMFGIYQLLFKLFQFKLYRYSELPTLYLDIQQFEILKH